MASEGRQRTIHRMDGLRIGRIARALRHRLGLTQREIARRAATSQPMVSLLERGQVERVSLPVIRRIFAVLEADCVLVVRWRAGDLDRLLDERHAGLGEAVTRLLTGLGWDAVPEVTYSVFGERGSIDILAWHPPTRTLLVIELKSELTSIEDTLRRHDTKVRLAARIAQERFGWRPASVARLVILPDNSTARRHVGRHEFLFSRPYPARNRAVRAFLRDPRTQAKATPFGGLLFMSSIGRTSGMRLSGPRRRVRTPRSAAN